MKTPRTPRNLRKLIEQIFRHYNRKTITREEFLGYLQEQGYTREQAIEIYKRAAKEKIIDTGIIADVDEQGHITKKTIVVEYMTEEDWEIIEAVKREIEQEEELKRILQKEPTEEEIKKILKELNPE